MLSHKQQSKVLTLPVISNTRRFDVVYDLLDQMHTAASEGNLPTFAGAPETEVVNWLRELIYVAQETVSEIEQQRPTRCEPKLRVLAKPARTHDDYQH